MKLTIPEPIRPTMKDYGINQTSDGLLGWEWVREQLEKSMNYWVSTTRPDGNPHAAPVWGVLVDDVVYFGTGETSRKGRNMQANPNVVLHTESGFDTVIVEGTVEITKERALMERIAPIYARLCTLQPVSSRLWPAHAAALPDAGHRSPRAAAKSTRVRSPASGSASRPTPPDDGTHDRKPLRTFRQTHDARTCGSILPPSQADNAVVIHCRMR
jgi:uncharacterized pyridoxamine 5'-phosphate oxidase family protein